MPVVKTTDGGETWIKNRSDSNGYISRDTWKRICFVNCSTGYFIVQSSNDLVKTSDSGNIWDATSCPVSGKYVVKFADSLNGMVYGFNYMDTTNPKYLYITTDAGNSWKTLPGVESDWGEDIEFFRGEKDKVLICTNDGLHYSENFGESWINITSQLNTDTMKVLRDLHITEDGCCWLFGDGGRVYKNTDLQHITDVEAEPAELPSQFYLYQNYPNPFNPVTSIKYALPEDTNVQLRVFDSLGREVKILENGYKAAGNYNIEFKASNFSSGIYFYNLIAGAYFKTMKCILIK